MYSQRVTVSTFSLISLFFKSNILIPNQSINPCPMESAPLIVSEPGASANWRSSLSRFQSWGFNKKMAYVNIPGGWSQGRYRGFSSIHSKGNYSRIVKSSLRCRKKMTRLLACISAARLVLVRESEGLWCGHGPPQTPDQFLRRSRPPFLP